MSPSLSFLIFGPMPGASTRARRPPAAPAAHSSPGLTDKRDPLTQLPPPLPLSLPRAGLPTAPLNGTAYGAAYSCANAPLPPTLGAALHAIVSDPAFWVRCAASGVIATLLYCGFGLVMSRRYPREVRVRRAPATASSPPPSLTRPPAPFPTAARRCRPSRARAARPWRAPLARTGPLTFGWP